MEENHVLSKHGPFQSKPVHKHTTPGSKEHLVYMEYVTKVWIDSLKISMRDVYLTLKLLFCLEGTLEAQVCKEIK